MRILRLLILLGIVVSGCSNAKEAYKSLGDLQQLHADLTTKYKEELSLNINNDKYLSISIINSKLNELPIEQKKQKAREIAVYAVGSYKNSNELETVSVGYVIHKSYIIINYTEAMEQYRFNVSELKNSDSNRAI